MQCENPPCIKAADNESVYRTAAGVVIIDPSKAAGQKGLMSEKACPYGVIYWNEERQLPQKCAFCLHRVEAGKPPRCVQACPSECLHFGDLSDPGSEVSQLIKSSKAEVFHPEWGTRPSVYYLGLSRITGHFISGTLIFSDTGECAEGVEVVIRGSDGRVIKVSTSAFGDFEADGLQPGRYSLSISFPGYRTQSLSVNLVKSLFLGEIKLAGL
jgi:hypothetical protein